MNKTTLVGALLAFGTLGLLGWWGATVGDPAHLQANSHAQGQTGGPQSPLTASELLYDFGTISMKSGLAEHRFTITNATDTAVRLASIYTSCMCTTAYLATDGQEKGPFGMQGMGYLPPANETLEPGESREVRVVYDPNAHGPAGVGRIERAVSVVDNQGRVLVLTVKGVVTP